MPDSFTYTPVAVTVLNFGNDHTPNVSFTPTDTTDYNNPAATVYKKRGLPLVVIYPGKWMVSGCPRAFARGGAKGVPRPMRGGSNRCAPRPKRSPLARRLRPCPTPPSAT